MKLERVRVLERRALSLSSSDPDGPTTLYQPGDELELPADEAEQLLADGFVEHA